jgi:hypothetical protein
VDQTWRALDQLLSENWDRNNRPVRLWAVTATFFDPSLGLEKYAALETGNNSSSANRRIPKSTWVEKLRYSQGFRSPCCVVPVASTKVPNDYCSLEMTRRRISRISILVLLVSLGLDTVFEEMEVTVRMVTLLRIMEYANLNLLPLLQGPSLTIQHMGWKRDHTVFWSVLPTTIPPNIVRFTEKRTVN